MNSACHIPWRTHILNSPPSDLILTPVANYTSVERMKRSFKRSLIEPEALLLLLLPLPLSLSQYPQNPSSFNPIYPPKRYLKQKSTPSKAWKVSIFNSPPRTQVIASLSTAITLKNSFAPPSPHPFSPKIFSTTPPSPKSSPLLPPSTTNVLTARLTPQPSRSPNAP